jgi:RHH-type proline utilization regulon transcriptional repressor/proline dehydrogenase/delta 1-pyrroline-5-carboxylate dehydrogenase
MASYDLLDPSIRQVEQSLAKQSHYHTPHMWDHRWWTRLLLDWGTRDDQLKVQLFRFIDVLPALSTDQQFIRLLHEYFHDVRSLPWNAG